MGTVHLLKLFGELLADAHRRTDDRCEVVPILLADFAADRRLIDAITRHAEITFHNAAGLRGPLEGVSGVAGTPLGLLIEEQFVHLKVQAQPLADGRVAMRIVGEQEPTNPGRRNLLGALSALLDETLPSQSLAIIGYDESNIDVETRRSLLKFFAETLPASGLALPRKIAVVMGNGAENLESFYYGPGGSIRFIVTPSGITERHSWSTNQREISRLARSEKGLVLFLGAGSSRSSGLPLGDELRDRALAQFLPHLEMPTEPTERNRLLRSGFYDWVSARRRFLPDEEQMSQEEFSNCLTLERVLREESYDFPGTGTTPTLLAFQKDEQVALAHVSSGIVALREILTLVPRLVIATVNFDRFVEGEGARADQVRIAASDEDFARVSDYLVDYLDGASGPVPVLKLHGTIDRPDTIIANVERTAQGLSEPKARALRTLVRSSADMLRWVYVGYSMRDPDIRAELALPSFAQGIHEMWVSPTVDRHVEPVAELRRPHWEETNSPARLSDRVITETADVFFVELRDQVVRSRSDRLSEGSPDR